MSDAVLTVLKFCLVALLYLFLVRVVWIVARELKGTPAPRPAPVPAPAAPTVATPKSTRWRLVVREPKAEKGRSYGIDGDTTIGRGGGCTIVITYDTFVSTVHARASLRDNGLWIEDVGSTNGTYVNGQRIQEPTRLRKGDKVKVGDVVFEAER